MGALCAGTGLHEELIGSMVLLQSFGQMHGIKIIGRVKGVVPECRDIFDRRGPVEGSLTGLYMLLLGPGATMCMHVCVHVCVYMHTGFGA